MRCGLCSANRAARSVIAALVDERRAYCAFLQELAFRGEQFDGLTFMQLGDGISLGRAKPGLVGCDRACMAKEVPAREFGEECSGYMCVADEIGGISDTQSIVVIAGMGMFHGDDFRALIDGKATAGRRRCEGDAGLLRAIPHDRRPSFDGRRE